MLKLINKSHYYFIGIGGIGMSGIAQILHQNGARVSGSNISGNENTTRLQNLGIQVFECHKASNVPHNAIVVLSSAINDANPELIQAKKLKLKIVKRAEALSAIIANKHCIAVAGAHGKTTTTALISHILNDLYDPLVVNGGIINNYGSNAYNGLGEVAIVETDESDGSFLHIKPTIAVVTNISFEHMEYFNTEENLLEYFLQFVNSIPVYGTIVLGIDDALVQKLLPRIKNRFIVTYGITHPADLQAVNIRIVNGCTMFDVKAANTSINNFTLPMFGQHNIQNALAALNVAVAMGHNLQDFTNSFTSFLGTKRRFDILHHNIIDDYAHHPDEIRSTILATTILLQSRNVTGKIYAVMEPHRYTRLQNLWDEFLNCFEGASCVFVTPLYTANEPPISGISETDFVKALQAKGIESHVVENPKQLYDFVAPVLRAEDIVLFMGAGNSTNWAHNFCKSLNSNEHFS